MNTISKTSTADEAWAVLQRKRFPLEHPPLVSLTEAHAERICRGYLENGCINATPTSEGDEVEPGSDLCKDDLKAEEKYYDDQRRKRDERDREAAGSQYTYLHADHVRALREARDQQIMMVKSIDKGKVA